MSIDDKKDFINQIEATRNKLLDLTRRNKILNFDKEKSFGANFLAIVDESPDFIFSNLYDDNKKMKLEPIPYIKEKDIDFCIENQLFNKNYSTETGLFIDNNFDKIKRDVNIKEWAKHNKISVNYDIRSYLHNEADKHTDNKLQTFCYSNEMNATIEKLLKKSNFFTQEKGVHSLFISLGSLLWKDIGGREYNSPLILIPIHIEKVKKTNGFQYYIEYNDSDIMFNVALKEKLFQEHHINLKSFQEEHFYMIEQYFEYIEEKITSEIQDWQLKRYVNVLVYDPQKILMYKDLDPNLWENESFLEHDLIQKAVDPDYQYEEEDIDFNNEYDQKELGEVELDRKYPVVYPADISQYEAIIKANKGLDLVIQGPPGTGKSQTISNIISNLLLEGKKVLFVSEKAAALDVVKSKLKEAGLGEVCLDLHGESLNKRKFLDSLQKRVNYIEKRYNVSDNELIYEEIEKRSQYINNYYKEINRVIAGIGLTYRDIINIINHYDKKYDNIINKYSIDDIEESLNQNMIESICRNILLAQEAEKEAKHYNVTHSINKSLFSDIGKNQVYLSDVQEWSEYFSRSYSIVNELINDLKILGLENTTSLSDIENVSDIIQTLNEIKKIKDINNIKLDSLQSETESMLLLKDAFNSDNGIKKENIIYRFENYKRMPQLAISILDSNRSLLENIEFANNANKIKADLLRLNEIFEELKNITGLKFSIDTIENLRQIYFIFDSSLKIENNSLVLNKDDLNFKDSDIYLENLKKRVKEMKTMFLNLNIDRSIDLVEKDSKKVEQLKKITNFIREAGFFTKVFSKEYKKNISTLKNLFKLNKDKISDDEIIVVSQHYINYLEKYNDFLQNPEFTSFGKLFKGIFTDFNSMNILKEWIDNINISPERPILNVDSKILFEFIQLLERNLLIIEEGIEEHKNLSLFLEYLENINNESNDIKNLEFFYDNAINAEKIQNVHSIIYQNLENIKDNYNVSLFDDELKSVEYFEYILSNSKFDILFNFYLNENNTAQNVNTLFSKLQKLTKSFDIKEQNDFYIYISNYDNWSIDNISLTIKRLKEEEIIREPFNRYNSSLIKISDIVPEMINSVPDIISLELDNVEIKNIVIALLFNNKIHNLINNIETLKNFNQTEYEVNRQKIKESILDSHKMTSFKILNELNKIEIPKGEKNNSKKKCTGLYLLENEFQKKMRHYPIRFTLEKAWGSISILKPCFMMSPSTVSEFLPKNNEIFDVLIIDEASQMFPENAIASIARTKQIIIVGDNKQLPPISHFSVSSDNEESDNMIDESESILELAGSFLEKQNKVALKWHYRSRHPSLIHFSNKEFYKGNLITFPAAKNSEILGIHFNYMENAVYEDSRNIAEAHSLLEKFIQRLKTRPDLTYGIVSINSKQADLLKDLFNNKLLEDEHFHDLYLEKEKTNEPIFIKNLENVQGDERDVIFISFVYGKKENSDKVLQRFGEINKKHGERYLNVLFSRARMTMEIFSSIKSNDISDVNVNEERQGKRILKEFLKFAEFGYKSQAVITNKEPDSLFEIDVMEELEKHGYQCEPQIGQEGFRIDIGIKDPNNEDNFILGIECDGATYHSDQITKDKDILKQSVLEGMGWNIHRIWSTNWFKDKDTEIEKIIKKLKNL